jgi:host factor-I protein
VSKGQVNLQDAFLNQVRREGIPLTVYLINGVQLKGTVKGFDSFTVVLENEGRQSMVYKHAISTLSPSRPVSLGAPERLEQAARDQDVAAEQRATPVEQRTTPAEQRATPADQRATPAEQPGTGEAR